VAEINSSLRKVRLIQWAVIAWLLISAGIAEAVCGRGNSDWTPRHWLVTGLAIWAASVGFRFRPRLLHRAMETLANDAASSKGLKQWEAGNGIGLLMAAGVAGWGLVIRFVLRGAAWQGSLFYAAGIFLLLLWTPRLPMRPLKVDRRNPS
jgi:hypothetical protein